MFKKRRENELRFSFRVPHLRGAHARRVDDFD